MATPPTSAFHLVERLSLTEGGRHSGAGAWTLVLKVCRKKGRTSDGTRLTRVSRWNRGRSTEVGVAGIIIIQYLRQLTST